MVAEYTSYMRKNYPWYSELNTLFLQDTISLKHAHALANDPTLKNYTFEFYQQNNNSMITLMLKSTLAENLYHQLSKITGAEDTFQLFKKITLADQDLLSGTYKSQLNADTFKIYFENDKLHFTQDGYVTELFKWKKDIYYIKDFRKPFLMIQDADSLTLSFSSYPVPGYKKIQD